MRGSEGSAMLIAYLGCRELHGQKAVLATTCKTLSIVSHKQEQVPLAYEMRVVACSG